MLRTVLFACTLPKAEADAPLCGKRARLHRYVGASLPALSQAGTLAHSPEWRTVGRRAGRTNHLHAHSRDAAQQGFYKACKTAKACRLQGLEVKYPHRRKHYRTTIWKQTGITRRGERLMLARARGLYPVVVPLPDNVLDLEAPTVLEARLVWDRAAHHYGWHLVVEDGRQSEPPPPGVHTAAVDLGEIHPAAVTDGKETVIISCRALRANQQYTAKRLSELRAKQVRKRKGSRSWRRLQRRKHRFLAKQRRRARDLDIRPAAPSCSGPGNAR